MNKEEYAKYVKEVTPTSSLPKNMCLAYIIGGMICVLGQAIFNIAMSFNIKEETAASIQVIVLVGLSALLTGLNVYCKIAKYAGAGSLVPITGFANSVASSAVEFKREGQVFGIGCKIFTIAGPVILYGILASWIAGIVYYIISLI